VTFLTATTGAMAFVLPMVLNPVMPTFNEMSLDRSIILSGRLEPYWAQVRTYLKPEDRFVVLLPAFPAQTDSIYQPFSYMGGFDYPILAGVVSGSGYSQTTPPDRLYIKKSLFLTYWGAYPIEERDELLREHPDLKFITLEQAVPFKLTLSSKDGPTIDLTRFMPADILAKANRAR